VWDDSGVVTRDDVHDPAATAGFLAYLRGAKARAVFTRAGFSIP